MENNWFDIENVKPLEWESGDWDGLRTDLVLVATDKCEILIARAYVDYIGASYNCIWCDVHDFEINGNVTHWQHLPEFPQDCC